MQGEVKIQKPIGDEVDADAIFIPKGIQKVEDSYRDTFSLFCKRTKAKSGNGVAQTSSEMDLVSFVDPNFDRHKEFVFAGSVVNTTCSCPRRTGRWTATFLHPIPP